MGRAGIEPATLGLKVLRRPLQMHATNGNSLQSRRIRTAGNCKELQAAETTRYSNRYSAQLPVKETSGCFEQKQSATSRGKGAGIEPAPFFRDGRLLMAWSSWRPSSAACSRRRRRAERPFDSTGRTGAPASTTWSRRPDCPESRLSSGRRRFASGMPRGSSGARTSDEFSCRTTARQGGLLLRNSSRGLRRPCADARLDGRRGKLDIGHRAAVRGGALAQSSGGFHYAASCANARRKTSSGWAPSTSNLRSSRTRSPALPEVVLSPAARR
jgi:hypothetical protein